LPDGKKARYSKPQSPHKKSIRTQVKGTFWALLPFEGFKKKAVDPEAGICTPLLLIKSLQTGKGAALLLWSILQAGQLTLPDYNLTLPDYNNTADSTDDIPAIMFNP